MLRLRQMQEVLGKGLGEHAPTIVCRYQDLHGSYVCDSVHRKVEKNTLTKLSLWGYSLIQQITAVS